MKLLVAIIGSLFLLAVAAAFCLFGFMATFEPTNNPGQFMAFRVGYGLVGVGCLIGTGFLVTLPWR